jgi:hypothetical protein
MVCPLAVGLGGIIWPVTASLEAALSVLVTIPVAGLAAAAQLRWQARNPGKPYLSWRMCVAIWCTTAGVLLGGLTDQPFVGRSPAVVWFVQLALLGGAVVFWLLAMRRWSKVGRNAWSGESPR